MGKWINKQGCNLSSVAVAAMLAQYCGSSITAQQLDATYRVGQVYQNGYIWFQRVG